MTDKRFRRMHYFAAMIMAAGVMALSTGCGGKSTENTTQTVAQQSAYESAEEILTVLWDNTAEQFPAFGGSFENPTDNAPGTISKEDKDLMSGTLLIPEEVQAHITDAASLFHMMNTNTFTGAALKLQGMSAEEAAGKIKEAFHNNQFMCGIPDKILIYTVGNDLVYCYGAADIIDSFKAAGEKLESGKLAADENY